MNNSLIALKSSLLEPISRKDNERHPFTFHASRLRTSSKVSIRTPLFWDWSVISIWPSKERQGLIVYRYQRQGTRNSWVRVEFELSSAIERNRTPTLVWVRFPNQSNPIELNPSDYVRLSPATENNRTEPNDLRSLHSTCVRWINLLEQSSYIMWSDCPLGKPKQAHEKQVFLVHYFLLII